MITDLASREILDAVDRCYVISKGIVLCEGSPDEVKQHPEVRRQYLGNIDGYTSNEGPPPPHWPEKAAVATVSAGAKPTTKRSFLRRRTDI